VWRVYQASKFGLVTSQLPTLLPEAHHAVSEYRGGAQAARLCVLALAYHAGTNTLTKLGQASLPSIRAVVATDREAPGPIYWATKDHVTISSSTRDSTNTVDRLALSRFRGDEPDKAVMLQAAYHDARIDHEHLGKVRDVGHGKPTKV
jgi:hypothetical protein